MPSAASGKAPQKTHLLHETLVAAQSEAGFSDTLVRELQLEDPLEYKAMFRMDVDNVPVSARCCDTSDQKDRHFIARVCLQFSVCK